MITNIEIKNVRSINHIKINFEKAKYKYLEENIFNKVLVNPIAFYGTNGSGKSSLLNSISDMIYLLVQDSNNLNQFFPNSVILEEYVEETKKKKVDNKKFYDDLKSFVRISFILDAESYEKAEEELKTSDLLQSDYDIVFKDLEVEDIKDYEVEEFD